MGSILLSLDYGRRAEYIFCTVMSPYALTIPIKGLDDKIESDFLCIGLEKKNEECFIPNLKRLFFVQCKSRKDKGKNKLTFKSAEQIKSVLSNKIPYLIALVSLTPKPMVSIYNTSEKLALCHQYPGIENLINKLNFHFKYQKNNIMYQYFPEKKSADIYTGDPIIEFNFESIERDESKYKKLEDILIREMENYHYSSVGLSYFQRTNLPGGNGEETNRVFFPLKGNIPEDTIKTLELSAELFSKLNDNKENLNNFAEVEKLKKIYWKNDLDKN